MKKTIYGSLLFVTMLFIIGNILNQGLNAQSPSDSSNMSSNTANSNNNGGAAKSSTPILYPSFSDKFGIYDNNKWLNVNGTWNYIPYGLHGGSNGKPQSGLNNILLSPVASGNQSIITTSFRINDMDNNVSNYVSIVNPFINPNNYQQAGINIYNGNTYVLFPKTINGALVNDPQWPGLKTNLTSNPGTLYIMSLITKNNSQDLVINGTKILSLTNTDHNSGYTGLSYGRVKDIVFYNFDLLNGFNSR